MPPGSRPWTGCVPRFGKNDPSRFGGRWLDITIGFSSVTFYPWASD